MKHDGFRYDFTGKELIYFLFRKKTCPKCNATMIRTKGFETVEGRYLNSSADPFFVPNAKVKHYQYYYNCQQCGASYALKELAK